MNGKKSRKEYLPLYVRIKSDIINRIAAGELKLGSRLPTEKEFCERFGVARITVQEALKQLVEEGIINRKQGSGSYIACDNFKEDYEDIFSHITSPPKTTISFGILSPSPERELLMRTLAGIYSIENPGIKVKIVHVERSEDSTDDPFMELIKGGKVPTIGEFYLHADYSGNDALIPLEKLPGFQLLADSLQSRCIYPTKDSSGKEHIHALATKVNSRIMLLNSDIAEKAGLNVDETPSSWRELEDWVSKLGAYTKQLKSGCYGVYTVMPFGWHGVIDKLPFLFDESLENENSINGFMKMIKTQRCHDGLRFLQKLHRIGNPCLDNGQELFSLGKVGILLSSVSWPILLTRFMRKNVNIKAFEIPSPEKNKPVHSVMGNYSIGIFRSAVKNQQELDAAWKWICFLFRRRHQFMLNSDLDLPAVKDVPSQLEKYSPDHYRIFLKTLKSSFPQYDFMGVRRLMSIFGHQAGQCILGEISPEECVNNTVTQIEKST